MNISKIAVKMNISTDTLRYYERIGLLPPVPRTNGGIRDYNKHFLEWISMIQELKEMGMSLEMIMEYFSLAKLGQITAKERKELIKEVRYSLAEKLQILQQRLKLIDYHLKNYNENLLLRTENLIQQKDIRKK